jgi:hypothetical protein
MFAGAMWQGRQTNSRKCEKKEKETEPQEREMEIEME